MADTAHLQQKLERVAETINRHPLSSPRVKTAFDVIERHGKDNSEAIARELSQRDLPSLEELGKLQVRHLLSWWNLHRRKRALEKKLA